MTRQPPQFNQDILALVSDNCLELTHAEIKPRHRRAIVRLTLEDMIEHPPGPSERDRSRSREKRVRAAYRENYTMGIVLSAVLMAAISAVVQYLVNRWLENHLNRDEAQSFIQGSASSERQEP